MKKQINLIFPVAGKAERFGGTFKPFLYIGDKTFIETTYEPFKKWSSNIQKVVFICTKSQNRDFNISSKLPQLIDHPNVEIIVIPNQTSGPYQTLKQGIKKGKIKGDSIICDCDHTLNVDPIFNKYLSNSYNGTIIPTWDIKENDWGNWSKVVTDKNQIKMICEKQKVTTEGFDVKGIIGCILFDRVEDKFLDSNLEYVSDSLNKLFINNHNLSIVDTPSANFYGDTKMLNSFIELRRGQCTIFCDIDGVLLHHHPHSTPDIEDNTLIPGFESLKMWKEKGHKIILTTARSKKFQPETEYLLSQLGIYYDEIIMDLPSGPRILINDHKPSKPFTSQANSIELTRDEGLSNIDITQYTFPNLETIIKTFPGGSFAKTYLLDNKVRKHIIKTKENFPHYEKLKRQVQDLIRLNFLWEGSTPKILGCQDTPYSFYYDMEYLENYIPMADLSTQKLENYLPQVLNCMDSNIYSLKKEVEGISWVDKFFDVKIWPKFLNFSKNPYLDTLINAEFVTINNKTYKGLRKILNELDKHLIKPKYIRPIHGDFTLENLMINPQGKIKLIDMDGSDFYDAAELDLGKMCQSIFSNYKDWKDLEDIVYDINLDNKEFNCDNRFFEIPNTPLIEKALSQWGSILHEDKDTTYNKGIFYMSMYFIRFVPFRLKQSENHGIFALIMAIVWLSKLLNKK